jgi:hypothetical protein
VSPSDATVPPDQHFARIADHEAWLQTGRALLKSAERVWARVDQLFADIGAISAQRREAIRRAISEHQGDPEALQAVFASVPPMMPTPLPVIVELGGFGNAYFLLAGYAVENILKAIRVKRLRREQKPVTFGAGDDRLPGRHRYVDMARVELGDVRDEEVVLLKRLELFVTWGGRYPVAKEPPRIADANGLSLGSNDKANVDALCQRLIDKYQAIGSPNG